MDIHTYICTECGKGYRAKHVNRKHVCPECASKHAQESVTQLHFHRGPYYEKWKQALKDRIGRL